MTLRRGARSKGSWADGDHAAADVILEYSERGALASDVPPRPDVGARPLLELAHVSVRFSTPDGEFTAVDDVSLDVARGTTLGVVGESGSGKSVLVRTVMDLLATNGTVDDRSTVRYEGRDVLHLNPLESHDLWGPEIAMIFQDPMTSLNPVKRIGTQVTETLRYHLRCSRAAARTRAIELLRDVGLPDPVRRLDQYPHELSGGMRQRVMIAIALSCHPKLVIADEPTTALDVTVQRQILDLLDRLQVDSGLTMILISHDLGVVAAHTDRVAIMYAGRVVETAPTERVFAGVRHPYTEALLASIPTIAAGRGATLTPIPGLPPSLVSRPLGCSFAPRCRYAQPRCVVEVPPLESPDGVHGAACFFPVHSAEGREALARNERTGQTATGLVVRRRELV